jgi:hypothetical protein
MLIVFSSIYKIIEITKEILIFILLNCYKYCLCIMNK